MPHGPERRGDEALYYPSIAFNDLQWLLYALMYWDKIERIVTNGLQQAPGNEPYEDELIHILSAEGLVGDHRLFFPPPDITQRFAQVVLEYNPHLRTRYAVPHDVDRRHGVSPGTGAQLSYLFEGKLGLFLGQCLVDSGLAVQGGAPEIFWMHPKLAAVYMTALAQDISRGSGFSAVTDRPEPLLGICCDSVEEIAEILLADDLPPQSRSQQDVETRFAAYCIHAYAPALDEFFAAGLSATPSDALDRYMIHRFLAYRTDPRTVALLRQFREGVQHVVSERMATLGDLDNSAAVKHHFATLYRHYIAPPQEELQRSLSDVCRTISAPLVTFGASAVSGLASYDLSQAHNPSGALVAAALAIGGLGAGGANIAASYCAVPGRRTPHPSAFLLRTRQQAEKWMSTTQPE